MVMESRTKIKLGITTKLLAVFLTLASVSLVSISAVAIYSMGQLGRFAEQSSLQLGEIAANDSAAALDESGKMAIRQKATDISNQVKIYLEAHRDIPIKEMTGLREIAVQPVGETGYTLMYERETAIMLFHVNNELIGFDMRNWADKLPAFWKIFEAGLSGETSSGYYDWEDADGNMRYKFMYVAPVEGTGYMIAATTYIDEFLKPSEEIRSSIRAAAIATSQYIEQHINRIQNILIMVILGILIVVATLAFLLAKTFSRPILALTEGAKAVGQGKLNYRVNIKTGDEIQELADQFNAMAIRLNESHSALERKVEERTRAERRRVEQLRALNEVGRKISSVMSIDELLPHVVNSFRETFKFYSVSIFLLEHASGDFILSATAVSGKKLAETLPRKITRGIAHWVAHTGKALMANDVSQEPQYLFSKDMPDTKSELAVPIRLATDVVGVLDIQTAEVNAFDDFDLFTAETLADEVAIAIENARLYQESHDIAVLEERNRLAREIHDTLAQGFTGIVLQLEVAEQALETDINQVRKHLDRARGLARENLKEARRSVWALRPQVLERLTLTEAIRQDVIKFAQIHGIKATFNTSVETRDLPSDTEDSLLRICQETITNVRKHAKATEVKVELDYGIDTVRLSIQDNGTGFDPQETSHGGFGLISMRERVRLLGGTLKVKSELDKGTLIVVEVPISNDNN